jgi:hypothetical protein
MTKFILLDLDIFAASNVSRGDNMVVMGMIGKDDVLTPTYGKIINNDYSGGFGEVDR